jgi:hypothetical protein
MTVRCKFVCQSKREYIGWGGENKTLYDYQFSAVTGPSHENKEFWKWTPSGTLNVSTVSDGQFETGKEYYLDITRADA